MMMMVAVVAMVLTIVVCGDGGAAAGDVEDRLYCEGEGDREAVGVCMGCVGGDGDREGGRLRLSLEGG